MTRSTFVLFALLGAAATVAACGSSGSPGASGSTSTTHGAGGSTTHGTGGSTTGATGGSTAHGSGGSTSSATAGTGGASGTGGLSAGACLGAADQAALAQHRSTLTYDVLDCGTQSSSMAETQTCIEQADGLSTACAACFVSEAACGIAVCLPDCEVNPPNLECGVCFAMHCASALIACAGFDPSQAPDAGADGG